MKIKLLAFGVFGDLTGKTNHNLENMNTVADVELFLKNNFPETENYKYKISVNAKITDSSTKLNEGDQVAILPPFAGG